MEMTKRTVYFDYSTIVSLPRMSEEQMKGIMDSKDWHDKVKFGYPDWEAWYEEDDTECDDGFDFDWNDFEIGEYDPEQQEDGTWLISLCGSGKAYVEELSDEEEAWERTMAELGLDMDYAWWVKSLHTIYFPEKYSMETI